MNEAAREVNFDGLAGPTHLFAGLAYGNKASLASRGEISNPRAAARQGLAKMAGLIELGLVQGVFPPQERPDVMTLRRLGFGGTDEQVVAAASRHRDLFVAMSSAAGMWVANAATVSPSTDTPDGRVHLTVANLATHLHRSIEAPHTARMLSATFPDESHFAHHPPLPAHADLGDEGAANHTRLASSHGEPGTSLFVYGRRGLEPSRSPGAFPGRQTREASEAVARLHGLDPQRAVFAQQAPEAIDAGVFHNDVIAVGNERLLFYHQAAFADPAWVCRALTEACPFDLELMEVEATEVSLAEAVDSYLFNSQLVSLPDGSSALICPERCRRVPSVARYLDAHVGQGPISQARFFDLDQSMRNGGGPACLRLRVVLNPDQLAAVNPGSLLTPGSITALEEWVDRHYRDELSLDDLADPQLLVEGRTALDELSGLLGLGSIYSFQQ
ncbi:MAG: N-succinylarginine dihydrolase [Acidimicrobiales bacterium]|nr:MAG: N-succinylarginine dihydrolase [Actinomycetota bacterium]MBV6510198.1 N-succinylarginine dihydrolase [Acidimicrobiales bacterium]RIK03525.1 MAG: N-succinylarginine dihydrolase [Acidobacteriota bacterium]